MLLAVGTERLETTRLGAGTVREEEVKDFLDRVHRLRLTRGDHPAGESRTPRPYQAL